MDDYWPEVRRNIKSEWKVWGRFMKLLRREGADPRVVEMFYREVTQVVLLFDVETWVILAAMERIMEGKHT